MTSAVDVVNQALEFTAQQVTITALNDGSVAGNAAGVIYSVVVLMMLRRWNPDFARKTVPLSQAGQPYSPWLNSYQYPTDCVRARCLVPPTVDLFDPQPIRGNVAFVGGITVIQTNQANASLAYTSSATTENNWDPVFQWAVVRALAEPLAMAVAGRSDFAQTLFMEAAQLGQMSELVEDSAIRGG